VGMANCKSAPTPVDSKQKLSSDDGELADDATFYRSITGALQYLTLTRPDIAYAVNQACLYMHSPRTAHWNLVKRILRYLRGTINHGLVISASPSTDLKAYSDADWGGCPDTRRSTSGYCVYLGDSLILGKHVRLPFKESTNVSHFPFLLLHCDVWTSPIISNSGYKFYLVILDDFSHYVWTFPLRHKSNVLPALIPCKRDELGEKS